MPCIANAPVKVEMYEQTPTYAPRDPTYPEQQVCEELMPLKRGTSDKTRSENIAKEIRAGKPKDQAAAIGYAVQRRAEASKKGKRK